MMSQNTPAADGKLDQGRGAAKAHENHDDKRDFDPRDGETRDDIEDHQAEDGRRQTSA